MRLLFLLGGLMPSVSMATVVILESHFTTIPDAKHYNLYVAEDGAAALDDARHFWGHMKHAIHHECKPGGWFAFLLTHDGHSTSMGRAGACNHMSRGAAKLAAIKSCTAKPDCAAGLVPRRNGQWTLVSGNDNRKYNARDAAALRDEWSRAKNPTPGTTPAHRGIGWDSEVCYLAGDADAQRGQCEVKVNVTQDFIDKRPAPEDFTTSVYTFDINDPKGPRKKLK